MEIRDKIEQTLNLPELEHLLDICKLLPVKADILEVGTFLGKCTSRMAETRPDCSITTLDVFKDGMWDEDLARRDSLLNNYLDNIFDGNMWTEDDVRTYLSIFSNVEVVNCAFPDQWNNDSKFNLIFEDGNHYWKETYKSFPRCIELLKSGGYLCLHDYDELGVEAAIEKFVEPHPQMKYHSKYKSLIVWQKDE